MIVKITSYKHWLWIALCYVPLQATTCVLTQINHVILIYIHTGTWDCPTTTGTQPPPCQGFTFTKVDSERVILFGGFQPNTRRRVNDVYILNLQTRVSQTNLHAQT